MNTKIEEKMSRKIYSVQSYESVLDVARQMAARKIGSLLVTQEGKYTGIITEGDIVRKVVSNDAPPGETLVSSVMTTSLITIESDDSLSEASSIMKKNNIRHLVVTKRGGIVAVISAGDLLQ
ncbi:MAG: CBS domain-containing protein [Nitrospirota bacterium]